MNRANTVEDRPNIEPATLYRRARLASEAVLECLHARRRGETLQGDTLRGESVGGLDLRSADPVYPSDQELYDDDRLNSIPRYDEQFGI